MLSETQHSQRQEVHVRQTEGGVTDVLLDIGDHEIPNAMAVPDTARPESMTTSTSFPFSLCVDRARLTERSPIE